MIDWREKSAAFGVHFLVTLVLSAGAAALVFLVWFPDPFQKMLGGTTLFEIMVLCDLGLGPLSSFIIYNSRKSRRALLFDYTVIGIIQLAAFIYGVYAVANNRPAYIVFVGDRFEVISAGEIDDADFARGGGSLQQATADVGTAARGNPEPEDSKEHNKMLFSGLAGQGLLRAAGILRSVRADGPGAQASSAARERAGKAPSGSEAAGRERSRGAASACRHDCVWMPVMHKSGFWTVLLDSGHRTACELVAGRPVLSGTNRTARSLRS